MMYSNNNPKYAIYTRKSSESEERQILSIQAQIDELTKRFDNLNIACLIEESGSAFKANHRPKFNYLLQQIEAGIINGIIAWHPDRLSRNPLDAAQIIHLIQLGKLQDLQFATYPFHNSPDGIMMLQISLSQSQFYSSKLSVDVTRGMNKKREKGWRPNRAPTGYLNDPASLKGEKKVYVDPERFPLIRKAFEMMLTGLYSVGYIQKKMNDEWGYLSRKTKLRGAAPMSISGLYKVFENKFYAGIIINPDGSESLGNHQPMITIDEYEKIRVILKARKGSHNQILEFPYKPLLACGHCGGKVTAERKHKRLANGKINRYHYYHCTHNKRDVRCKQPSIEENQITLALCKIMDKIMIHPILKTWTLHALDTVKTSDESDTAGLSNSIRTLEKRRKKIDEAYYDELISKEEFKTQREELNNKINKLKQSKMIKQEKRQQSRQHHLKIIDFLVEGKHILKNGDTDEKRELLQMIASNYSIFNRKLNIELKNWVTEVEKFNQKYRARFDSFEPLKNCSAIDLLHQNQDIYLAWSSTGENIRTNNCLELNFKS